MHRETQGLLQLAATLSKYHKKEHQSVNQKRITTKATQIT